MLRLIGLDTIEPLFSGIPDSLRNPPINLPSPLAELELISEMSDIAAQNSTTPMVASFLGGGAYNHFIPSAVRAITSRSEFYTSYTPYQPEVSQGTLQAIFEFQSLVCQLTGMDVANASMYDGSTALAEAALMSIGITHKRKLAIPSTIHPEYREVVKTYCSGRGLELRVMEGTTGCVSPVWVKEAVDGDTAALLLQYPNFFGCIEDISAIAREVHAAGALLIIATNPIALGLVRSPGSYGADIVTGEGQPLGIPTGFGGPFLGLLATREPYVRQLPGRLVGMTSDDRGQRGYVLTLQAREQHIRREKATSNICTNEGLCALAATVYLSLMGPRGLRQVAETCVRRAHYAASQIGALPGYSLPFGHTFFNEFVVRCPRPPSEINHRLLSAGILGGLELGGWYPDLADCLLLCVTEMNTRLQIDRLVSILVEFAQ
jgi:glycine dehydrogenase subunit 1